MANFEQKTNRNSGAQMCARFALASAVLIGPGAIIGGIFEDHLHQETKTNLASDQAEQLQHPSEALAAKISEEAYAVKSYGISDKYTPGVLLGATSESLAFTAGLAIYRSARRKPQWPGAISTVMDWIGGEDQ